MVIRTKTRQQIHEWFADQWRNIVEQFPQEYAEGELNRMEKMFQGLSGRSGEARPCTTDTPNHSLD